MSSSKKDGAGPSMSPNVPMGPGAVYANGMAYMQPTHPQMMTPASYQMQMQQQMMATPNQQL